MAAVPSIDLSGWLDEQLAQASPDLLRAMVTDVRRGVDGRRGRRGLRRRRIGERSEERVNTRNGYRRPGVGHPGRQRSSWRSRSCAQGSYFPDWLLERRRRAEAALVTRGGDLLSARGLDPADGQAGARRSGITRLSKSQVSRDGEGPRRAGRGVPHPAAGRRPLHVPGRRRAGAQGPRGWAHRQRARAARDRR